MLLFSSAFHFNSQAMADLGLISVDFNGANTFSTTGNPGPTAQGAAFVGSLGDTWNGLNGSNGSFANLVNSSNAPTGVSIAWSSGLSYFIGGSNQTPKPDLSDDFLRNVISVTLSNLPTNTYNLYLYSNDDINQRDTPPRSTTFTVNTVVLPTVFQQDTPGSWLLAQNYMATTVTTSGTITITTVGTLNGLQLVAVPEPSSLMLSGFGVALIVRLVRRRMA